MRPRSGCCWPRCWPSGWRSRPSPRPRPGRPRPRPPRPRLSRRRLAGQGQGSAAKAPTAPAKARAVEPKDLLEQGRKALEAGQFDKAQDLARQADAANPSGRWGLFGDTPESLENDVRDARATADKAEGEKLLKQAREMMARAAAAKAPADKMAAYNQAFAMADRAVGPVRAGRLLGRPDRRRPGQGPQGHRRRPDAAPQDHAGVGAGQAAGVGPDPGATTPRTAGPVAKAGPGGKPSFTPTGKPSFTPGVQPVAGTGKPADAAKVTTAGLTTPAKGTPTPAKGLPTPSRRTRPIKATAARLVADGRTLLKKNQLAEARAGRTRPASSRPRSARPRTARTPSCGTSWPTASDR